MPLARSNGNHRESLSSPLLHDHTCQPAAPLASTSFARLLELSPWALPSLHCTSSTIVFVNYCFVLRYSLMLSCLTCSVGIQDL